MPTQMTVDGFTFLAERPQGSIVRPPILFVHGMFVGGWVWENYLRYFAERGYPGYALTLRGHEGGATVMDLGRVSLHDFVEEAVAAARALPASPAGAGAPGGDRPVVMGHSMGGLIAQKV